jgi:general secretion pathway protein H
MVVMAVVTLLLAITPPLLTAAIPGLELRTSARQIASGLRLAREEAIRSGGEAAFVLDVEERVFQVDGPFRPTHIPDGLELKLEAAEREMQSDSVGAIRFFPDGTSTGGRVIVSRGDAGWQVGAQWLTGRVELAPWDGE